MKKFYTTLASLLLVFQVFAQFENTMFFMNHLPQSNKINVAQTPNCSFYMGGLLLPIFGELPPAMGFSVNLPFDYGDVIFRGKGAYADSLITPLHPTADVDDFLKKLRKLNYISTELQLDLLNMGIKCGEKGYLTFDFSERMQAYVGLPGDLLQFAVKGNETVRNARWDGLGSHATYFHQLGVGFNHKNENGSWGIKAKFLVGVANAQSTKSKLQLITEEQTNNIRLKADYQFNTNVPIDVMLDENGRINEVAFSAFDEMEVGDIVKDYALLTGNYGFATDLGFSRNVNGFVTCYGSVVDLGFINWKSGRQLSFQDQDSVNFEGIDVENLIKTGEFDADSLINIIDRYTYEDNVAYRSWLPTKVYLGAKVLVAKRISIGALGKFQFLPHKVVPSATISANFNLFKFTNISLSYSCMNGNSNDLGLGITAHPGPFQWYLVTDNLVSAALFPTNERSIGLRFGCNLVIGYVRTVSRDLDMRNSQRLYRGVKKSNKGIMPYHY